MKMKKNGEKDDKKVLFNKLILIGNGFDLALGLKTTYNDFLFWLLKKEILRSLEKFPNRVAAVGHFKYNDFFKHNEEILVYGFSSNKLFDVLINTNYNSIPKCINDCDDLNNLLKTLDNFKISINPIKNSLFKKILDTSYVGWVDIESMYFEFLKKCLKSNEKNNLIDTLNDDLEAISEFLKEYLNEIEIYTTPQDAFHYIEQFYSEINIKDVITKEGELKSISPNYVYFLNFNYTESVNLIVEGSGFDNSKTFINQIHSTAFGENPIIFGFGDEMDDVYKEIENLNDNRYLKFIKSFHYFKSSNYRDLLRFLNSGYFQVCIYGHSCGLSDRVMLNEIFEHDYCKSIKIYFLDEEDFNKKTMNISRHFNSNKLMREKIVNYDPKNKIPQLKID